MNPFDGSTTGSYGQPRRPCINFAQGHCRHGEACKFLHDVNIKPDPSAVELYNRGELGGGSQNRSNNTGGFKPCNAFLAGNCTFGDRCRFSHNGAPPAAMQDGGGGAGGLRKPCFAFQRGQCQAGDACMYSHDEEDNSGANSIQFNKKPCFSWQSTGTCSRGESCTFAHKSGPAQGAATGAFAASFANLGANSGIGFASASSGAGGDSNNAQATPRPFHPAIFCGHIGNHVLTLESSTSKTGSYDDSESSAAALPTHDEKGNRIHRSFEINFSKKAYFLEGVSIVPNGVEPPTFATADGTFVHESSQVMKGQTEPLDGQSIDLKIYGFNLDTSRLELLSEINYPGGNRLQWYPFKKPANSIAINHVILEGTFENMSLIFHGGEIASTLLNANAVQLLEKGAPVPPGWEDPDLIEEKYDYSSGEDGEEGEEGEASNTDSEVPRKGDRMKLEALPTASQIKALWVRPEELQKRILTKLESANNQDNSSTLCFGSFASAECPSLPMSALVSTASVSALIDHILESNSSVTSSVVETRIKVLSEMEHFFKQVWKSAKTVVELEEMRSKDDSSASSYDGLSSLLDEDVVTMASSMVQQALSTLNLEASSYRNTLRQAHNHTDGNNSNNTDDDDLNFLSLGTQALLCAHAMMDNQMTATAFSRVGGLTCLAQLARQEPRLPSNVHAIVLSCLQRSVRHYESAAPMLTASTVFDNSPYQDLLELSETVRINETVISENLQSALNTLTLVNAVQDLKSHCQSQLDVVSDIGKQLMEYLSKINATETANTMVVDENTLNALLRAQATASGRIHACSKILRELYKQTVEKVAAVDAAINCCAAASEYSVHSNRGYNRASLVSLLIDANLTGCLCFLATFTELCKDFAAAADWGAPSMGELPGMAHGSFISFALLVNTIFSMHGGTYILASNPQAAHLLWQYLVQDESLITTQSFSEFDNWANTYGEVSTGNIHSIRANTIGWHAAMSFHVNFTVGNAMHHLAPNTMQSLQKNIHVEGTSWVDSLVALVQLSSSTLAQELISIQASRTLVPLLVLKCKNLLTAGVRTFTQTDWYGFECALKIIGVCLKYANELTMESLMAFDFHEKDKNLYITVKELLETALAAGLPSQIQVIAKGLSKVNGISDVVDSRTALNKLKSISSVKAVEDGGMSALFGINSALKMINSSLSLSPSLFLDNATVLLEVSVAVATQCVCWARRGAGWAVDAGVTTAGYAVFEHSPTDAHSKQREQLFQKHSPISLTAAPPLPNEGDLAGKVSQIISQAELLRKSILLALTCLEYVILTLYGSGANNGPHVSAVPEVCCEIYSFCHQCLKLESIDKVGSDARCIAAKCVAILSYYCPPSVWAKSPSASGLIPWLHAQAVQVPRFQASNMHLLASLKQNALSHGVIKSMICRSSGYRFGCRKSVSDTDCFPCNTNAGLRAIQWQMIAFTSEDVEDAFSGTGNENENDSEKILSSSSTFHIAMNRLMSGSGGADYGKNRLFRLFMKHRTNTVVQWQQIYDSLPLTIGINSDQIIPFSQARLPLAAQSAALSALSKGEVQAMTALVRPTCEKVTTSYWTNIAIQNHVESNMTSDPQYFVKLYRQVCPQNPASAVLSALTSCDINSHRAAFAYTHAIVNASAQSGSIILIPILASLQNSLCFYLQQCKNPLTRVTEHNSATVTAALIEPSHLNETSSELCRFLLFLERLTCDDAGCMLVCSHGGLKTLLLAMHSLRQEVVVISLQVLTNCYRSLNRISIATQQHVSACKTAYHAAAKAAANKADGIHHSVIDDEEVGGTNEANDGSDDISDVDPESPYGVALALDTVLKQVSKELADSLVEILPPCLSRFMAADGALVLIQAAFLLPLLSYQHSKALLDNLASGMTVEVLCIKLWLSVEDAFQSLIEASEVIRTLLTYKGNSDESRQGVNSDGFSLGVTPDSAEASFVLGEDGGLTHIRTALSQAAAAVCALRYALETVVLAYSRGWISLVVLQRTLRSTLVDPKHLVAGYQRIYMIWSNDRVQLKAMRRAWVLRNAKRRKATDDRKRRAANNSDSDDDDDDNTDGKATPFAPLQRCEDAGYLRDDHTGDDEAWHAIIAVSLAKLKDVAVTSRQHFSKQVDRHSLSDRFATIASTGGNIDLQYPLGGKVQYFRADLSSDTISPTADGGATRTTSGPSASAKLLLDWYALPQNCLPSNANIQRDDTLHRALVRTAVSGDDRKVSLFQYSKKYIRLSSLSRLVDPQGPERRRERRNLRSEALAAQKKEVSRRKRVAAESAAAEQAQKKSRLDAQNAELGGSSFASDPSLANIPKALLMRKLGAKAGAGQVVQVPNSTMPVPPLPPGSTGLTTGLPPPPPPPGSTGLPPPPLAPR